MAAVKDYYELLGLKKDASADDIKRTYRKLARKCHPDLNPGDKKAEEKFKKISEAYAVLGDQAKKQEYDSSGRSPFEGMSFDKGAPPFEDIFEFGFGDIFSDIFDTSGKKGPSQQARRGADITSAINISLEEAYSGVTRKMTFTREVSCKSCGGTGIAASAACARCMGSGKVKQSKGFFQVEHICPECRGAGRKVTKNCTACKEQGKTYKTETTNIKIPAGAENGSTVRLRGMGNAGPGGGPSGNMRLKVTVKPHALFERKGSDLYLKLPVTFKEAALGAKIEVPTIDGTAVMTLPPGTQGGQRLKLTGKGFTNRGGTGKRGNMFVDIGIAVPKGLGQKDRELLDKLEVLYSEDPRKNIKK